MYEFTIKFDFESSKPLYQQLYEHIKSEIINGHFEAGCKIPTTRKLCSHLRISRNTVYAAYGQLQAEGYIESKERSGFYVAKDLNIQYFDINSKEKPPFDERILYPHKPSHPIKYDFKYGQIDYKSFPFALWRKAILQWFNCENNELLAYGDKQGERSLRQELAKYIRNARGVKCTAEQIILTSGTQMSLDLICKLIQDEYRCIAVEDPGYIGGRTIFILNNYKIKPIPLEPTGISLECLIDSKAKAVLIAPSHQFPYGMVMPISKRIELLKWAEENDGIIIENDYEGELSYIGKPIPSLQNLDSSERVIYLYTFSSSLLPSIRISFLVLPSRLLGKFQAKLGTLEQTVPIIEQKTLEFFISAGHWEKHVRRMKKAYYKKSSALIKTIENMMNHHIEIIGSNAGLHILLKVKNSMSENELIEKAAQAGVRVYPTSQFWLNKNSVNESLVLLGFGGMNEEEIKEGINLLYQAWF